MNIVWFTWKDINHPHAGGAENISWHLVQDLTKHGHHVHIITAQYQGALAYETYQGVEISRAGGRISVYRKARHIYKKQLSVWADLVIDEMNTIPFGARFYSQKPAVLLTYQLARSVWFYQMRFPLSVIGYALEPVYLRLLSTRYRRVVTESESTKTDLQRYGFSQNAIGVFRVGIELKPLASLPAQNDLNSILILGAMRPMKQTLDAVKGFESARDANPALRLTIAGDNSGPYAQKVMEYIDRSRHHTAITVLGRVSFNEKLGLMHQATLILVTSVKEGWGLIVTEANSQGTPAIAYDCDGLRDSVVDNKTGLLVTPGDTAGLGTAINTMVTDAKRYQKLRQAAWESSKQYTFSNCYQDFTRTAGIEPKVS